jgi:hypothetical protein
MSTLASRLIGSARFSTRSYEEVEADHHANAQAIGVVLLSSLAAAVGVGIRDLWSTLLLLVFVIVSWIIWVLLTLFIGTQLLPRNETRADFGQILRTTGFSSIPGVFRIFGLLPGIGWLIFLGANIWMLFSFVVAIRQALDFKSTGRALAVSLLGWIIHGMLFLGFVEIAL